MQPSSRSLKLQAAEPKPATDACAQPASCAKTPQPAGCAASSPRLRVASLRSCSLQAAQSLRNTQFASCAASKSSSSLSRAQPQAAGCAAESLCRLQPALRAAHSLCKLAGKLRSLNQPAQACNAQPASCAALQALGMSGLRRVGPGLRSLQARDAQA